MKPLIELKNIILKKDSRTVLDLPELKIYKGDRVVLTGPNGAGKSSLLDLIALIEKPVSGEIYFESELISKKNVIQFRRRISLLSQKPNLHSATVMQNVALPLKIRGLDKKYINKNVEKWLERLHLTQLANRMAYKLSGGEAQRVALARMMISEPEVLLFDEPLNNLDKESKANFSKLLSELLIESSNTFIYVSHNDTEANSLVAKKTIYIENGRIINNLSEKH